MENSAKQHYSNWNLSILKKDGRAVRSMVCGWARKPTEDQITMVLRRFCIRFDIGTGLVAGLRYRCKKGLAHIYEVSVEAA